MGRGGELSGGVWCCWGQGRGAETQGAPSVRTQSLTSLVPSPSYLGARKGRTGRQLQGAAPPQAGGVGPSREAGPLTRVGVSRPGEWVSSETLTRLPGTLAAEALAGCGLAPPPPLLAPPAPSLCLRERGGLMTPAA